MSGEDEALGDFMGARPTEESEVVPLNDEEFGDLVHSMKQKLLATDQRLLAAQALRGRTVTGHQGGRLLQVVNLGIMQRLLAFEVLEGRISDLPEGLPHLLEPLSGQIQIDIGFRIGGHHFDPVDYGHTRSSWNSSDSCGDRSVRSGHTSPTVGRLSPLSSVLSRSTPSLPPAQDMSRRLPEHSESLERLRQDVCGEDVPDVLYEDVRAVFDNLGLGALPPKKSNPNSPVMGVHGGGNHLPQLARSQSPQQQRGVPTPNSPLTLPAVPGATNAGKGLNIGVGPLNHQVANYLPGQVDQLESPRSDSSEESV